MQSLIGLFFEIVLHRKGPQDVPPAGVVLGFTLIAYLATGGIVLWPSAADMSIVLAQLAVDLTLMVLIFGGLLAATGRADRMRQTFAALFGTSALLSVAALPFVWIATTAFVEDAPSPGVGLPVLLSTLALFMLLLVSLLVTGHILRHALNWSYAAGVLVAAGYFAVSVTVFRALFPVA